jgi:hypothetical protein
MRTIVTLTILTLFLSYATYLLLMAPFISHSVKWYIFGGHMMLIPVTGVLAVLGIFRRSRFCIFALLAIIPLVYLQFLSGSLR